MTALDWVLVSVVAVSALLGLLRGLIGVVMSLVAWLLAGLAAYLFGGDVGRSLVADGQLGWGEYLGGYALSFLVVWIAVALLGMLIRRLAHSAGLSGVDRLFGLGLGVARGVFFACVLVLLLGMTSMPAQRAWHESTAVSLLLPGAQWMRACLPEWMRQRVDLEGRGTSLQAEVQAHADNLKSAMPNGLPASIPEMLPEAVPSLLPRMLPQAAPQPDPKLVTPGQQSNGIKTDDKLVH